MNHIHKLEKLLDERLNKKAPVRLPKGARAYIADALWVLALVLGVVQLWIMLDRLALRMLLEPYSPGAVDPHFGFFYYLSLIILTIAAVLLLLASPALKARKKEGWNMLFYALLATVVYGVVRLFAEPGGFVAMLFVLLASAVAAYVLFQVRGLFTGSTHSSGHHDAATTHTK